MALRCTTRAPVASSSRPLRLAASASRARRPCAPLAAAASAKEFLEDCHMLGKVRFIVIGEGAILESVGVFGRPKYLEVPNRGTLATISTEDKEFECHIYLSKLKEVRLAKTKSKIGDRELYATRFIGDAEKVIMSCLLHSTKGEYEAEAVRAWEGLREKYGDTLKFDAAPPAVPVAAPVPAASHAAA